MRAIVALRDRGPDDPTRKASDTAEPPTRREAGERPPPAASGAVASVPSTMPEAGLEPDGDDGPLPVAPGQVVLGKYRIERALGRGGMGVVFVALHEGLGQRFAIKFLLPGKDQAAAIARFQHEARAAARIDNEHVARVIDVGVLERGTPYMIMEYLEGSDLAEVLRTRGALSVLDAVDYLMQALDGIADAHALGIVHRDLKPSNLFLTTRPNGAPLLKVLDFGIAKSDIARADGKDSLTSSGAIMGSPRYMSPEQIRSTKAVDRRSDVWSLGIILYELLTCGVPFADSSTGEIFAAVLQDEPASLRKARPEVPLALEAVVTRCLARDREERWQSAADLARALAPYASNRSRTIVERFSALSVETRTVERPLPPMAKPGAGSVRPRDPTFGGVAGTTGEASSGEPRKASSTTMLLVGAAGIGVIGAVAAFAWARLRDAGPEPQPPAIAFTAAPPAVELPPAASAPGAASPRERPPGAYAAGPTAPSTTAPSLEVDAGASAAAIPAPLAPPRLLGAPSRRPHAASTGDPAPSPASPRSPSDLLEHRE